jgi:hypothetical protein
MTKEVLKLALEALEGYVNVVVSVNDPNEWTPKVADAGEPARKAIAAIKEALAQPEQDGKCKYCTDGCPACDARKLPPQRTWVGLTDEDFYGQSELQVMAMKYAEAKLKEKNHG